MWIQEKIDAFVVRQQRVRDTENPIDAIGALTEIGFEELDEGEVLIRVAYSAINFKDALASTGDPGVARKFPLVPGIDAVGEVIESRDERFVPADLVMIAHAKFGTSHHGGFATCARVPADWVYRLPEGLGMEEAAAWGTAGFTAAMSVEALVDGGIKPGDGPVLVTGATGGVGIFSVKLLSKLGYTVVASTGKLEKSDWLRELGASEVISRDELLDESLAPLLKARWSAAIDSVGGKTLATLIRAAKPHACVTACGLVGGLDLHLTVLPFILRGVRLSGIDSAGVSRQIRQDLWERIAGEWNLGCLADVVTEIGLDELPQAIEKILKGENVGRVRIAVQSLEREDFREDEVDGEASGG